MSNNIKAYPELRGIISVDTSPTGIGGNPEWSMEDHVVNYMARSQRLLKAIEGEYPAFFIEKEIELCEERLEELRQIIKRNS